MLLAFITFFVFAFTYLTSGKTLKRRILLVAAIAVVACVFLTFISVSNVWTPNPLSDAVFRAQNSFGEYEGVFPWSKLSYPLYLNVYHTSFENLTFTYTPHLTGNGEARFSIFFANTKILVVGANYSYFAAAVGSMPLYYRIDFPFSNSTDFFAFLMTIFGLFNILGAVLGIISAKILRSSLKKGCPTKCVAESEKRDFF